MLVIWPLAVRAALFTLVRPVRILTIMFWSTSAFSTFGQFGDVGMNQLNFAALANGAIFGFIGTTRTIRSRAREAAKLAGHSDLAELAEGGEHARAKNVIVSVPHGSDKREKRHTHGEQPDHQHPQLVVTVAPNRGRGPRFPASRGSRRRGACRAGGRDACAGSPPAICRRYLLLLRHRESSIGAVLGYPIYFLVRLSFQRYDLPELIHGRGLDAGGEAARPSSTTPRSGTCWRGRSSSPWSTCP